MIELACTPDLETKGRARATRTRLGLAQGTKRPSSEEPRHLRPRRQSEKLRAGIVGLGRQAIHEQVPAVRAAHAATLVAICDEDPQVRQEQEALLGIPAYSDIHEMLDKEQLDLVVVAVPHHAGREVIEAAASRKVHVLKEKPLGLDLAEALDLADCCDRAGIHLAVALQRRFNPVYETFLDLADHVGKPFFFEARYTLHVDDPGEGWRGQRTTAGGGCIIDMGYHLIDLIIWYFGLPDRVLADLSTNARPDRRYDAEDTAVIQVAYEDGFYGSVLLSRYIGPKAEELRLVGSDGIVLLGRTGVRRLTNDGQVVESFDRRLAPHAAEQLQIEHFCRVIEGSQVNHATPTDHLAHMALVAACYQSARERRYVNPKELL